MRKIYIIGPLSNGHIGHNLNEAVQMTTWLFRNGFAPYCPHLMLFADAISPMTHEEWMALTRIWMISCEAAIRLPGPSTGSEQQEGICSEKGIPVFQSVDELLDWSTALEILSGA